MGVWKRSEQVILKAWAALLSLFVHTDKDTKTDKRDWEGEKASSLSKDNTGTRRMDILCWGKRGTNPFILVKEQTFRIRTPAFWALHSPHQEGGVGRRGKIKRLGNVFALAPSLHPFTVSSTPGGNSMDIQ